MHHGFLAGDVLPPSQTPVLCRSLHFLCSRWGPARSYPSSACPVNARLSKHGRFIQFWNELNFTLEREDGGKKTACDSPKKTLIKYNLLQKDLLPSLDKADLVLAASTEFHSYCSWTWEKWQGKDINISRGWERDVFQVRQKQWVFWTPHTSEKSNFLSQALQWSKNALGSQRLGC